MHHPRSTVPERSNNDPLMIVGLDVDHSKSVQLNLYLEDKVRTYGYRRGLNPSVSAAACIIFYLGLQVTCVK